MAPPADLSALAQRSSQQHSEPRGGAPRLPTAVSGGSGAEVPVSGLPDFPSPALREWVPLGSTSSLLQKDSVCILVPELSERPRFPSCP